MVDQAQVTPANGQAELPPQKVAQNTAGFFHDVATLGELQAQLAIVDLRLCLSKLLTPIIVLAVGAAIGLGTIPIALAALALAIAANTELSLAACFGIAHAVGAVLCIALVVPSILALRGGSRLFDRSRYELGRNVNWFKETLKRLSQGPPPPTPSRTSRAAW